MRLTLIDMLVLFALPTVAAGLAPIVMVRLGLPGKGMAPVVVIALIVVANVLFVAPAVYRRMKWLPPWLPRCPHCGVRPDRYRIMPTGAWPHLVVSCGVCERETQLLLARSGKAEHLAEPTLELRWPHCFGIWKRIA